MNQSSFLFHLFINFDHFMDSYLWVFFHLRFTVFRILLADIRKDIVLNASQAERQTTEHKSYLKKTAEARKQIIHYETK